jgi:tetratricopeptide (TPR) repeat protein
MRRPRIRIQPLSLLFSLAVISTGCSQGKSQAPADAQLLPDSTVSQAADLKRLNGQAHDLDLAGKHDEAIAVYTRALGIDPQSFDAHYGLGRALDLAGRYEEARQHFAVAIDRAPDDQKDQATRMLGIAWTFVGDIDHAAPYFRTTFDRLMAANNFDGAADVANELGRVYLELGHLDEAETWYRTGHDTAARIAKRPEWQVRLGDMRLAHAEARIAARRGRAAEARRQEVVVKKLLEEGGNDDQKIQLPYLLGYDAFYLGRYRDAIVELERADQKDPFILCLLGQAHEKLGESARAREYYSAAVASSSHAVAAAFARPVALARLQGH